MLGMPGSSEPVRVLGLHDQQMHRWALILHVRLNGTKCEIMIYTESKLWVREDKLRLSPQ
jgi:hypothetical protein